MKVLLVAVAAAVLVSGCATTKNWSATGGSRADATVRLSYEYGAFDDDARRELARFPNPSDFFAIIRSADPRLGNTSGISEDKSWLGF